MFAVRSCRFVGRDDAVVNSGWNFNGDEQNVVYLTATPTAGIGYELNVALAWQTTNIESQVNSC